MASPTPLELLRRTTGFADLTSAEFDQLAHHTSVRQWSDGEHVLRKGDPSDSMHLLVAGAARVPIAAADGVKTFPLATGALFGEIGMLSGSPRTADVIADGPCATLILRRDHVEPLLWEHPRLARLLTSLVRQRLKRSGDLSRVGKYRLGDQIGKGASSDVFEATHEQLGRVVAVKMLSHSLAFDRPLSSRFLHEARVVAGLEHPNIVRLYDLESTLATHFIVMERLRGRDLRDVLGQRGHLTVPEAESLLGQAAAALAFAHQRGVAHGDIKPANCGVEDGGTLKLMDFGLASRADGADAGDGLIVGTPRYMAPELIRGAPADASTDTYALGVMACELLTGRPPFVAADPRQVMRAHLEQPVPDLSGLGLPEHLARFVQSALAKDPGDRPQDLAPVARALQSAPVELDSRVARVTLRLDYEASRQPEIDALVASVQEAAAGLATVHVRRRQAGAEVDGATITAAQQVPQTVVQERS